MAERKIDIFFRRQVKIGSITLTWLDILFILAICVLALLARLEFYPLLSGDYKGFLSNWMARIQEYGAWNSLGTRVSNYTSPYMYFMCLVSGFSNSLAALKSVSVFFDYVTAFAMFLLVVQLTGSTRKGVLAIAITLFCPTVMINSAWWCQCDSIYCSFLIFALYFFFKDKSALCCIFLGLSFAFKVQAVFLLPFFIMMWLKRKTIKIWHLLYIPLVYFVLNVPAWIAGRPLGELMTVYFGQAGLYPWGTLKYPNIYEFLDETMKHKHYMAEIGGWGLYFSIGIIGILTYYVTARKFKLNETLMVTLALFSVCLALYTMPHMHERYGFIVDLLAIVYALQRPRKAAVSILYIAISQITYMPFLIGVYVFPFSVLAVVMLGLNIYVGYDLCTQIKENQLPEGA